MCSLTIDYDIFSCYYVGNFKNCPARGVAVQHLSSTRILPGDAGNEILQARPCPVFYNIGQGLAYFKN